MNEKGYLEPDLMSTSWGGFYVDIGAGKIAMSMLGSWYPPSIPNEGDRGMFPFPGAKNVTIGDDWRFAVAKSSKSVDLAKAYFKHLFMDGAYYPLMNVSSPIKGAVYPFNFIAELTKYGVPTLEVAPTSDDLQAVLNEFAVDLGDVTQAYLLAKDPATVIADYNAKWAAARKAAGK
jgi:raffinose/stachyose/melibiose transport system substrate-binding protein